MSLWRYSVRGDNLNTPSDFIKLKVLDEDEIYNHDETRYALSWSGYTLNITEQDIEHLKNGKPLMLVVNDEYIEILKLAK